MGYALYRKDRILWAAGTHEYRPMGVAAIAATDLFRPRDFTPKIKPPHEKEAEFLGFFASIVDLNDYLTRQRTPKRGADRGARVPEVGKLSPQPEPADENRATPPILRTGGDSQEQEQLAARGNLLAGEHSPTQGIPRSGCYKGRS